MSQLDKEAWVTNEKTWLLNESFFPSDFMQIHFFFNPPFEMFMQVFFTSCTLSTNFFQMGGKHSQAGKRRNRCYKRFITKAPSFAYFLSQPLINHSGRHHRRHSQQWWAFLFPSTSLAFSYCGHKCRFNHPSVTARVSRAHWLGCSSFAPHPQRVLDANQMRFIASGAFAICQVRNLRLRPYKIKLTAMKAVMSFC